MGLPITKKAARIAKFSAKALGLIIGVLTAVLLVGLYPVNNQFQPSSDGVTIYLVSNSVHADIIVPLSSEQHDWTPLVNSTHFPDDVAHSTHVAFGWGDKGFFLETKTWDDLKLSTVANALLLPSDSCVHVSLTRPEYCAEKVSLTISREQYARLTAFIDQSFVKSKDGKCIQITGYSYHGTDAFLEARGRYHFFNTCNSWVGRALKQAGVKVPAWSPLPRTPMLYIKSEEAPTNSPFPAPT